MQDLQKQIEGEFHAFFDGEIVRGCSFFANPKLSVLRLAVKAVSARSRDKLQAMRVHSTRMTGWMMDYMAIWSGLRVQ